MGTYKFDTFVRLRDGRKREKVSNLYVPIDTLTTRIFFYSGVCNRLHRKRERKNHEHVGFSNQV